MQLKRRRVAKDKHQCLDFEGQVPLVSLREGEKASITHITGSSNVVLRLSEMGLTPGCELILLRKCSFQGPIEIEVRSAALAIGYALASEICVMPVKAN
jgi:Fe2+ transport system protein FeoA